jgi:hypothetical protein
MAELSENIQMNVTEPQEQPQPQEKAQEQAQEQVQIDLNTQVNVPLYLLINVRNLIDLTTSRGTYKSNELSSVGKIYDELASVINAVAQKAISESESSIEITTETTSLSTSTTE